MRLASRPGPWARMASEVPCLETRSTGITCSIPDPARWPTIVTLSVGFLSRAASARLRLAGGWRFCALPVIISVTTIVLPAGYSVARSLMASISPANADDENRLLGDAAAGDAE